MTAKDWILLLTPIVINGVVLYWFQLMISERIKKNDAKKEVVKNIYEKYLIMTDKALKSYRETIGFLVNAKNETERDVIDFNMALNLLRYDVRNLQCYYRDYKYVLGDREDLLEMYEQLDDIFKQQSSGDISCVGEFLQKGEKILQGILEITLRNMLKL